MDSEQAYALYRLPFANSYIEVRQTSGHVEELASPAALCGKSGFVMAPFAANDQCPVLLIRADSIEVKKAAHATSRDTTCKTTTHDRRERYAIDFANYHSMLLNGEFKKIVLARTAVDETDENISPEELFLRACALYPRMFVALVSTPKSGTWLVATPETLLEGDGHQWHTMALAGTMKLQGEQLLLDNPPRQGRNEELKGLTWSTKNMAEQRLVSTYVTETLERFTNDFTEEGPYTVRAGNLVHLRSDFHFTLADNMLVGELLAALHPTPAVCGLPKDSTFRFIINNEAMPRRYYSGFMGPLATNGQTHLFVSLRCMEIEQTRYRLYAGGGLLPDSTEENEWLETEAKMETMRQCLQTKTTSTY